MNKHTLLAATIACLSFSASAADPVWLGDFRKADLNDSGGLSKTEAGKTTSTRLQTLRNSFAVIDADQDGHVTRNEYESYLAQQKTRLTTKQFNRLDLNDSGGLSRVELDKTADKSFDSLKQHFDSIDRDKDGQLSYAEYEAFVQPAASPNAAAAAAAVPIATAAIAIPKDACQPNCGVVLAVDRYKIEGEGSPLGMIAGGVAGGLLGNQVGGGTGKTIATVGGAAGGAYVGKELEKKFKTRKMVKVTVKLDSGEQKDFDFEAETSPVGKGDRVRIEDGKPVKYTGQ